MKYIGRIVIAVILLVAPLGAAAQPPKERTAPPVGVVVASSLATGRERIRQYAFDGDPKTYFASAKNADKADSFTLTFERPVTVKSVAVTTGKPNGEDALDAGVLEGSADGRTFTPLGKFGAGKATVKSLSQRLRAIRVRPTKALTHPLVVREIEVQSEPAVRVFKYPVEFVVNTEEVPELKEWAEAAARVCEQHYGMICDELMSDGFKPRTIIPMTITTKYNGVAMASRSRITGSAKYFKSHPTDVGAMVHETVHCVQQYRARNNPGWLVEGVADYIRFWKYEPGKAGRLSLRRAKYDGSYRVTAAFLAYLAEKHDPQIVKKLNARMRAGKYSEAVWKELTGKSVEQLNQEWRQSLAR
jgi:hypothetical protein